MCLPIFAGIGAALGAGAGSAAAVGTATVVSAIGTGISAYSSYASGQTTKKAAEYTAEMDRRASQDALQLGAAEGADAKQRARQIIARQNAATGAAGFDSSTGTPLDLATEAAGFGELDALKSINNAQRRASGLNAQANLTTYQGRMAAQGGLLTAGGTLFSGAASAMNSFYGRAPFWDKNKV
jgi:hypothetical protein